MKPDAEIVEPNGNLALLWSEGLLCLVRCYISLSFFIFYQQHFLSSHLRLLNDLTSSLRIIYKAIYE